MHHVTQEWWLLVTHHTLNKSCLQYENEVCHTWMRHVSYVSRIWIRHVQNIKMTHVTYEWDVRHASYVCDVFHYVFHTSRYFITCVTYFIRLCDICICVWRICVWRISFAFVCDVFHRKCVWRICAWRISFSYVRHDVFIHFIHMCDIWEIHCVWYRGDLFTPPIYHTYEYVASNVWKWNMAHTNEACLTCITRMNTLCLEYEHNICIYIHMYIYMLTICVYIYHNICIYVHVYLHVICIYIDITCRCVMSHTWMGHVSHVSHVQGGEDA